MNYTRQEDRYFRKRPERSRYKIVNIAKMKGEIKSSMKYIASHKLSLPQK